MGAMERNTGPQIHSQPVTHQLLRVEIKIKAQTHPLVGSTDYLKHFFDDDKQRNWDLLTTSLSGGYLKHLSVMADYRRTAYCQEDKSTEIVFLGWGDGWLSAWHISFMTWIRINNPCQRLATGVSVHL